MCRRIASITSVLFVCGLMATASYGQLLGVYEFDGGGDGTSWDEAANWEQKLDPFGVPISGDPATPPDGVTTADIPVAGVVIDGTMPGQTALDVNIGTVVGAGSLSISGGDLLAGRDVFVGRDNVNGINGGSLVMSGGTLDAGDDIEVGAGSVGSMTMSDGLASTGDDFFVNAGSSLTVTGGTIHVGDRLVTDAGATINVDGGSIVADDDFYFNAGSEQITVDSGSMIVQDKLRMDLAGTTLTVNGGLVRTQEFGFCSTTDCSTSYVMNGTLEINGSGIFQSQAPDVGSPISQLSERRPRP